MPLPPALLKRLAKRGLVDKSVKQKSIAAQAPTEEIIAEDYDDVNDEPKSFCSSPLELKKNFSE